MDISETSRDGALVIAATGRIDSSTAAALEAVLPERVREQKITILSLADVLYVSSAGLRVLLIGAKAAKATGNKLILTGLSPAVREVFDISGFSKIFTIEDDVEAALAAIA
jgi:anti-sigma B factor antagonist